MPNRDIGFTFWEASVGDIRNNAPGTCLWCGKKLRFSYDSVYDYYWPERSRCCKATLDEDHCCEGCGNHIYKSRRLISRKRRYDRPGAYADGAFCTMRCGYMFGVAAAQNGFRLQPLGDDA